MKVDGFDQTTCVATAFGYCDISCPGCDDPAVCESSAVCYGTSELQDYLTNAGLGTAGCFSSFYPDFTGSVFCEDAPDNPWGLFFFFITCAHTTTGCLLLDVTNQADCEAGGNRWLDATYNTQAACEAHRGMNSVIFFSHFPGCMSGIDLYNDKDEGNCTCSGETFQPYFTWKTVRHVNISLFDTSRERTSQLMCDSCCG